MKILITGTAGFIGYHLTKKILQETDYQIVGLDNINDYYDVDLKYARLWDTGISHKSKNWHQPIKSNRFPAYRFIRMNLEDKEQLLELFHTEKFDMVCHLAAQAGVRYSLQAPFAYINSNVVGFMNILEGCRNSKIKLLLYASSSSVYGNNTTYPFKETQSVDTPISLYAATKKSNELMAYTYYHLYKIPVIGLRFFTVYGSWGRPDMAYYLFTKNILRKIPIKVFNNGNVYRDFTYIDDITGVMQKIFEKNRDNPSNKSFYKLYNIGNTQSMKVTKMISILEECMREKAILRLCKAQPGDVFKTHADISKLAKDYGYAPSTNFKDGIKEFVKWYKEYHHK